ASRVPGPRSRTARANHRCAVGIGRGRRGPSVEVPAVAAAEGSAHRWTFTQNTRTGAWGPGLCCEGAPPAGAAQSPRPAGRVSKPGVLAATTAFGKTVIAAWLIARRGVNTLVLVHRQQLLEQWVERLATFLDEPAKSIGRLGGGRKNLTGRLDVALIQSLARKGVV